MTQFTHNVEFCHFVTDDCNCLAFRQNNYGRFDYELKCFGPGTGRDQMFSAWLKLWDECGSTVKQRESEQAYPHSCVCPLRGHNRDCRHTNTSLVCSRKIRRAGRDSCLRHIRLCLKGKSHMLLSVFISIQTPSESQTKRFGSFFNSFIFVRYESIWTSMSLFRHFKYQMWSQ